MRVKDSWLITLINFSALYDLVQAYVHLNLIHRQVKHLFGPHGSFDSTPSHLRIQAKHFCSQSAFPLRPARPGDQTNGRSLLEQVWCQLQHWQFPPVASPVHPGRADLSGSVLSPRPNHFLVPRRRLPAIVQRLG